MSEGFGLMIPLPPALARECPVAELGGVGHRPHVTVVYFRPGTREDAARAAAVASALAGVVEAFPVHLTGGVHTFEPSEASEGRRVVVAAVQSEGALRLRERFLAALARAGVHAPQSHPGFVPHVTLAYLTEGEAYSGPVPSGTFEAESLEIWRGSTIERLPLDARGWGSELSAAPVNPITAGRGGEDGFVKADTFELPASVVAALRRGLALVEAGRAGEGLRPATVREAREGARRRRWTGEKIRRAAAWFARHAANTPTRGWDKPGEESPGFVAWTLWGDEGDGRGRRALEALAARAEKAASWPADLTVGI